MILINFMSIIEINLMVSVGRNSQPGPEDSPYYLVIHLRCTITVAIHHTKTWHNGVDTDQRRKIRSLLYHKINKIAGIVFKIWIKMKFASGKETLAKQLNFHLKPATKHVVNDKRC